MDAIKNLLGRKSSKDLEAPFPSKKEMDIVYQSALRAPDHAWLRPSKFLEFKGESLEELSKIFTNFANDHFKDDKAFIEKAKLAPFRAPMVIVLITEIKDHPKVPAVEQMLSTSAATQNILLALHALGYGAIWKTGKLALNENIPKYFNLDKNHHILGYIYIGTKSGDDRKVPDVNIEDFVTRH